MKCPVCKTEVGDKGICPECGYNDISPIFLSIAEEAAWIDSVVWPFRYRFWQSLTDFDIRGKTIYDYVGSHETVIIPYGIEEIGTDAFWGCETIREVIFPSTLRIIGAGAFEESTVTYATFPDRLEIIDAGAFARSYMSNGYIPDGVTSIGEYAFDDCTMLGEVWIPKSVLCIEESAFSGNSTCIFHCEPKEKPICWDDHWYDEMGQTVLWGQTWKKTTDSSKIYTR